MELAGLPAGLSYKARTGIADLGADPTQSLNLRTLRPGRYLLTTTLIIGDLVLRRERRIKGAAAR